MKNELSQQQTQRLQQRLVPLQIQIGKMLEMTGPEIEDEVRHKLEELPALEAVDEKDDSSEISSDTPSDDSYSAAESTGDYDDPSPEDLRAIDPLDYRNRSRDDDFIAPVAVSDEESLAEHLLNQLPELDLSPLTLHAAEAIIGNLDSRGYLARALSAIAVDLSIETGLEFTDEVMQEAFSAVRSLEPPGVGAEDLRDTLLLQLSRLRFAGKPEVELAYVIVDQHFDSLTKKHHDKLTRRLGVDADSLRRALDIISHLNPKPGNQFGDSAMERSGRMIIPEFRVEPVGNRLEVTLLNRLPHLVVSQSFGEESTASARLSKGEAAYIKSHRNEALDFIYALQKRQDTLFQVMAAIAQLQRDFFMTGDETRLKPMGLKDIEQATGLDLSVISRVTSSKYVICVGGLYPLKFFFNERLAVDAADDATFPRIAEALREIIAAENKKSPLSDDAITSLLNQKGFAVARRTVAKYRERLGFPVARLRKEL